MRLEQFSEQHYDFLISWIHSEEHMYLWSGPTYSYPLDCAQVKAHCSKPEVNPFIVFNDAQPIGFTELYKVTQRHYRICRVIVAKEYRGQGLSKIMLNLIIDKALTDFGAWKLSLGVFERNRIAQNCYRDLGFKVRSVDRQSRIVNGEAWPLITMEKSLIPTRLKRISDTWAFRHT